MISRSLKIGVALVAAIALCAAAAMRWNYADIASDLAEAEKMRTADRAEFARILAELSDKAHRATPEQRQRLRLLRAYQMVRTGDNAAAVGELKSLMSIDSDDGVIGFRAAALLANAYVLTRQFQEGLSIVDTLLAKLPDIEDRVARHQALLASAVLYNQVGQYDLARAQVEQVLRDAASERNACFANNLRLEALQYLGRPQNDAAYYDAIARCRAQGETIATNLVRSYLARKWGDEGRHGEAVRLLESHLAEAQATGYPYLIGEFHALIADYRMVLGDADAAERHARAVVALHPDLADTLPPATAYRVLQRLAEAKGEAGAADRFRGEFAQANRAYLDERAARDRIFQRHRHQASQSRRPI